jgi:predicted signal transduction protein with EAL and GGDEF domain
VRGNDVVARLGGDEFVIMLRDPASRDAATTLAQRITVLMRHAFTIAGQEVFVGVSIGIARSTPADDPASLLRHADLAMYRAKADGRNRVTVYDAQMETATLAALDLDTALRRAVERGELALTLQPIVGLPGREVVGVEALVRWRRPLYGLLPPASFIPAAEDTGLVVEIGRWVLLESVTWLAGWHRRHPGSTLTAAVNVSGRQLREAGFADEVLDIIAGQGLRPQLLTLELTESTLVDDADADAVLDRLRRAGVRIALDDFGTGYSSLTRLRNLPVDVLKLDRTFVAPLVGDDPAQPRRCRRAPRQAMGLDLVVGASRGRVRGDHRARRHAGAVPLRRPMAPDVASHWLADQPVRHPVALA